MGTKLNTLSKIALMPENGLLIKPRYNGSAMQWALKNTPKPAFLKAVKIAL